MPRLLTFRQFFAILRRRTRANAARIDREIERRGLCRVVALMADSSGFSRRTQKYGILQFLSVMAQAYDEILPLVTRHGGQTLSAVADNLLALFEAPGDAARAALAMHARLARRNRGRPDAERFHICIGIHMGPAIRLSDDAYGDTINVSAVVGEDVAKRNETLVTDEVAAALRGRFRLRCAKTVRIGARRFRLHRLLASR